MARWLCIDSYIWNKDFDLYTDKMDQSVISWNLTEIKIQIMDRASEASAGVSENNFVVPLLRFLKPKDNFLIPVSELF